MQDEKSGDENLVDSPFNFSGNTPPWMKSGDKKENLMNKGEKHGRLRSKRSRS